MVVHCPSSMHAVHSCGQSALGCGSLGSVGPLGPDLHSQHGLLSVPEPKSAQREKSASTHGVCIKSVGSRSAHPACSRPAIILHSPLGSLGSLGWALVSASRHATCASHWARAYILAASTSTCNLRRTNLSLCGCTLKEESKRGPTVSFRSLSKVCVEEWRTASGRDRSDRSGKDCYGTRSPVKISEFQLQYSVYICM